MTEPAKLGTELYALPGRSPTFAGHADDTGRPAWCRCGRPVATWRTKHDDGRGGKVLGERYSAGQCEACGERGRRDRLEAAKVQPETTGGRTWR